MYAYMYAIRRDYYVLVPADGFRIGDEIYTVYNFHSGGFWGEKLAFLQQENKRL